MEKKQHIHFVGIKGVGMTALAILVKEKGYKVTGSDVVEEFVTEEVLKKCKIPVAIGFNASNLNAKPDLVIVTGAHGGKTNPEAVTWATQGVEVITHGEAVGKFMQNSLGISVCGVGGKTTTSAMLATLLTDAKLEPSYVVGAGKIYPLGNPGHNGRGKYFVAEADEYASCPLTDLTPRLLYQHPQIAVVTNIEFDHPDIYKSLEQTLGVFSEFISGLPENGFSVINIDNANNREIIKRAKNKRIITYGFSQEADYRVDKVSFVPGSTKFAVKTANLNMGEFTLSVPGKFNALNAASVIVVGLELGLSVKQIQEGLAKFKGTKRRFELIGEKNRVKLYDDYAHHPAEISSTLLATREWFKKEKIIIIFQPHTYSRTKLLLKEFSQSFGLADEVLVMPIFASAREKNDPTINSQILVNAISFYQPQVQYIKDEEQVIEYLNNKLASGTVVMTMGAGDIYKIGKSILKII